MPLRCIARHGPRLRSRYTGLLETVRIRRAGYPLRMPMAAFVERCGHCTLPATFGEGALLMRTLESPPPLTGVFGMDAAGLAC